MAVLMDYELVAEMGSLTVALLAVEMVPFAVAKSENNNMVVAMVD